MTYPSRLVQMRQVNARLASELDRHGVCVFSLGICQSPNKSLNPLISPGPFGQLNRWDDCSPTRICSTRDFRCYFCQLSCCHIAISEYNMANSKLRICVAAWEIEIMAALLTVIRKLGVQFTELGVPMMSLVALSDECWKSHRE